MCAQQLSIHLNVCAQQLSIHLSNAYFQQLCHPSFSQRTRSDNNNISTKLQNNNAFSNNNNEDKDNKDNSLSSIITSRRKSPISVQKQTYCNLKSNGILKVSGFCKTKNFRCSINQTTLSSFNVYLHLYISYCLITCFILIAPRGISLCDISNVWMIFRQVAT